MGPRAGGPTAGAFALSGRQPSIDLTQGGHVASAQRGRAVSAVNGVLALGLVFALAAFALVVNPPAPPGIAEFAPQATKPITKAPLGQSAGRGAATDGPCAANGACGPSPTATGAVAGPTPVPTKSGGVASTKQCYAWPDGSVTQTWDPQSPPCIADWPERARGNGGATARGVSKAEIRVAVPLEQGTHDWQPLVRFFNSHFELYDRRIVLVPFPAQAENGSHGGRDPAAQRADAETVGSLRPFASLTYPGGQSDTRTFLRGVTASGIVTVTAANQVTIGSESQLRGENPYAWNYSPTSTDLLAATATMICRQLAGRPAKHSLDYVSAKRSFAVVIPNQEYLQGHLDGLEQLRDALAACGVPRPRVVEYVHPQDSQDPSANVSAMVQLKKDGITSLIYWPTSGGSASAGAPQKAASGVGYHPEWIIPGYSSASVYALGIGAPDEVRSSFGIASWNHVQALSERPSYRAYAESVGDAPPEDVAVQPQLYEALYRSLLLVASGVQTAGPQLTPQRFATALQATVFPNPGAGSSPDYQAHVGFAEDHVMVDDFAAFWFDPNQTTDPTGEPAKDPFCYVQSGRRWTAASWPAGGDAFRPGGIC